MTTSTELTRKCLHKCVVKTGVSLFLPPDLIKYDRLVAAVGRTNITPADLLTIFSVLIPIGSGDLKAVNLRHSYIPNSLNKITETISPNIRQTWTASKNLLVHWDDKINPTLDVDSKENACQFLSLEQSISC